MWQWRFFPRRLRPVSRPSPRRPRRAGPGPHLERLEDRVNPATLTINNNFGTLTYQAGAGVNNDFSLTGDATTYAFQDVAEPITLAGDTAGWSVTSFGAGSRA